jgi:hypothetical protein
MTQTTRTRASSDSAIAADRALAVAQADAAQAYRDLSPYRIQLVLEGDGWHIDYVAARTMLSIQTRVRLSPSGTNNKFPFSSVLSTTAFRPTLLQGLGILHLARSFPTMRK